jgi:pyruvate-formate lyase-activating enzyme
MRPEGRLFNRRDAVVPDFPTKVHIETVMGCNLRCPMCPVSNTKEFMNGRTFTYMAPALYRQIIDELSVSGRKHDIWLNQLGEPTLHKQIVEFVRLGRSRGHDVSMTSNGTRLTPKLSDSLIKAGLTQIVFSIDGADQATYEKIRVGGRYDDVVRNVEDFCARNRAAGSPVAVRVDCIDTTLAKGQHEAFVKFWSPKAATQFIPLSDWSGQMPIPVEFGVPPARPTPPHRYACHLLWSTFTVAADGAGMYCCHDYRLQSKLPNVADVGLGGLWRAVGEERARQVAGDFTHTPCADCTEWQRMPEKYKGWQIQVIDPLRRFVLKAPGGEFLRRVKHQLTMHH